MSLRKSIILIPLLVVNLGFYTISSSQFTQGFVSFPTSRISTVYVEHATIYISSNENFINQATTEGWPGEGTSSDPYIISNYEIDGSGTGTLIYVSDTTVHFQVVAVVEVYLIPESTLYCPEFHIQVVGDVYIGNLKLVYLDTDGGDASV